VTSEARKELSSPKALLDQHGLRPKHSFGQNFLCEQRHAERIAEMAAPTGQERVLEIGAGLGALTDKLLRRGCSVVAIERDRDLLPILEREFEADTKTGRLEIVAADAKTADWEGLFGDHPRRVLAGNLPYQITGPLLRRTVSLAGQLERAVYLVQKEVGDRLAASPASGAYGALSVFTQAAFVVERALTIRPGSFYPAPRVDSAVVVLSPHPEPLAVETPLFRAVVKLAFAARRKTLRNAWRALGAGDALERIAERAGVRLDARGETLGVAEFARVTQGLLELGLEADLLSVQTTDDDA
jgi:16S rRNA (adenine1518-N6/adenine1519-N6)-dimethyltransferase